jgi:hypothetical protein
MPYLIHRRPLPNFMTFAKDNDTVIKISKIFVFLVFPLYFIASNISGTGKYDVIIFLILSVCGIILLVDRLRTDKY